MYNEPNINICFSGSLREEIIFPKFITFGLEIGYLQNSGNLYSLISDWTGDEIICTHHLTISSLDIPVFFKIRTNPDITKGIYFYLGNSICYIFNSNTKVTAIDKVILEKKVNFNNNFFDMGFIGAGKIIKIMKKKFLCEIKYNFGLTELIYPINNAINDPVNKYINWNINFKQNSLLLNLGYVF